jgi:S1-C subfamily serine protease
VRPTPSSVSRPQLPVEDAPTSDLDASGQGGLARRTVAVVAVAAVLGGVVGAGVTLAASGQLGDDTVAGRAAETDPVRAPVVESATPGQGQGIVSAVAAAVLPSVVRINVLADQDDPDLGTVQVQIGVGSGVIYRSDGYLLTNNHVVENADRLTVQFSDGTSIAAVIVGTDPLTDLAVLQVEREGLPAVNLREDDPLQVGETAVAIGSPFGLDASVTAGVVSALNRDLEVPGDATSGALVIPALIQTDAAINPGNSGGALVDATGRLIGINTAILTGSGGSQGVGFAIPTRSAVIAAEQLIDRGFVSHPFLGISGLDVTNEVEARYREDYDIDLDGGALVDQVVDGSGADLGGVQAGDVVVRVGDEAITGMTDVIAVILRFDPQDEVDIEVLRAGERLTLAVVLGERPR